MGHAEFVEVATLTAAIFGDEEEVGFRFFHGETANAISFDLELHAADAHCTASHATHFIDVEGVDEAFTSGHEDLVSGLGERNLNDGIAFFNVDGDNTTTIDIAIIGECGALDRTIGEHKGDIAVFIKARDGENFHNALILLQALEHIDNRRTRRCARTFSDREGFLLVNAAGVGEEKEIVMCIRHVDAFDEVCILNLHARKACATTSLGAVVGELGTLHITTMREGDDRRHIRGDGTQVKVAHFRNNLREAVAFLRVLSLHLFKVLLDEGEDFGGVFKDCLQFCDASLQLCLFIEELVAFQTRQLAQTHFEDGLNLCIREAETFTEARTCFIVGFGVADDVNDLVKIVLCNEQAVHDVDALLSLAQIKARTTGVHIEAVINVALEEIAQRHALRTTMIQCDHICAEGCLQVGVLVKLIEDDFTRVGILLEFNDYADTILEARFIADVRDALDDAILHEVGHLGDHGGLVYHVGN